MTLPNSLEVKMTNVKSFGILFRERWRIMVVAAAASFLVIQGVSSLIYQAESSERRTELLANIQTKLDAAEARLTDQLQDSYCVNGC